MIDVSVVVVSYNVKDLLLECLRAAAAAAAGVTCEIIVVDNGSSDGSVAAVARRFPGVRLIANRENAGFAGANNQGFASSRGRHILLLNPDTEPRGDAIAAMVRFMDATPTAGMAGCLLVNPDGSVQPSVRSFPSPWRQLLQAFFLDRVLFAENRPGFYRGAARRVDFCTGAALIVRREAVEGPDLLSTRYFMYSEEKDLALRLKRRGWETWWVPQATVVHHGHRSTDQMPIAMFEHLQQSQVTYFRTLHPPLRASLLSASWALVLLTNYLVSLPLAAAGRPGRARLFVAGLVAFRRAASARSPAAAHKDPGQGSPETSHRTVSSTTIPQKGI